MTDRSEKNRAQRIRRKLDRDGYLLRKSRSRTWNLDNHGEYMVLDASMNLPVLGARYDASLEDVEAWMRA